MHFRTSSCCTLYAVRSLLSSPLFEGARCMVCVRVWLAVRTSTGGHQSSWSEGDDVIDGRYSSQQQACPMYSSASCTDARGWDGCTGRMHGRDAGRTSMTARNASSAISSVGTKDAPTPALFTRHVIGCPAATATSATTLLQSPAEFTSNWQGREGKWGRGDPMILLATSTIHSRCRILVSATSRPQCRSKRWCLASHRCEK